MNTGLCKISQRPVGQRGSQSQFMCLQCEFACPRCHTGFASDGNQRPARAFTFPASVCCRIFPQKTNFTVCLSVVFMNSLQLVFVYLVILPCPITISRLQICCSRLLSLPRIAFNMPPCFGYTYAPRVCLEGLPDDAQTWHRVSVSLKVFDNGLL